MKILIKQYSIKLISIFFVIIFSGVISAYANDFPKVHMIYLSPSDKQVSDDYIDGMEKAVLSIQSFYSQQLNGQVFTTTNPIVQVVESSNNSTWHGESMWSRAIDTVGATFNDPNNIYIIYVDADLACSPNNGIGGTSGIAVNGANDLRGLVEEPITPSCSGFVDNAPVNRWIGGLGHELGHALGAPHPDGCDNNSTTSCDSNALMWLGFRAYPTYLNDATKAVFINSGFFSTQYQQPKPLPLVDNFESGINWHNTSNFDWRLNSGFTPSNNTGPSIAQQGASYLYFDSAANETSQLGNTALLESDVFNSEQAKLTFWYHMYGSDTGALSVEVSQNGIWSQVWSRSGQQHSAATDSWSKVLIRLNSYSGNTKVRFRAQASNGSRGDIAIDNIRIHNGIEMLQATFDGTWFYTEWTPAINTTDYTQFVIGNGNGPQKSLYRRNSGSDDRGDFLYQYYHRNDICNAFNAVGTYSLSAQIWPGSDSGSAVGLGSAGSITCF